MGGGLGHVCTAIARKHKNFRFMGQDLNTVVERGRAVVAEQAPDVTERIQFMEHSFWDPQTIAADVYFMRIVLHDWADNACFKNLEEYHPRNETELEDPDIGRTTSGGKVGASCGG
ncbi:hypothetical protein FN846DRAFT_984792 [Sphaerosporella brunnea]|uniref:O-methyltransferase C-terminal domain-containing protein n=1 Tax=Sphaerosporella brunnea TaxID=1250544 RepID=A0A5J5EUZ2_9PEZI|nr:hypothetical protein FN846DRAFT_984792 [Sphaerosporella brunnea]